jgi:hypothetical protein
MVTTGVVKTFRDLCNERTEDPKCKLCVMLSVSIKPLQWARMLLSQLFQGHALKS